MLNLFLGPCGKELCDHYNQPPYGCHSTSIPLNLYLGQKVSTAQPRNRIPYPSQQEVQGWRELGRTVTQIDLSLPDQVTALMGQLKTEAQNSLEIWKIRHGVLTFLQCMHECSGMSNSPELTNTILWTVAHQALLSIGFSRQESWSGLPCPPPGDLPNPGIELRSPALKVGSLPLRNL